MSAAGGYRSWNKIKDSGRLLFDEPNWPGFLRQCHPNTKDGSKSQLHNHNNYYNYHNNIINANAGNNIWGAHISVVAVGCHRYPILHCSHALPNWCLQLLLFLIWAIFYRCLSLFFIFIDSNSFFILSYKLIWGTYCMTCIQYFVNIWGGVAVDS